MSREAKLARDAGDEVVIVQALTSFLEGTRSDWQESTSYRLKDVTDVAKVACPPAVRVLACLAGRSAGPSEAEFVTDGRELQKDLSTDIQDQP